MAETKETKAVTTYRKALIQRLKLRRGDIRSGRVNPIDQNGTKIMQSNLVINTAAKETIDMGESVSILATRGANGELTRIIHMLEKEGEDV